MPKDLRSTEVGQKRKKTKKERNRKIVPVTFALIIIVINNFYETFSL